jgi:FkbM family methyltransferase
MKLKKSHQLIAGSIRPIELASLIKKILRIKRGEHSLANGCTFYLDPASNFGMRLIKNGNYESECTNAILNILGEGDTFVDLGANEGYFSILASKKVGKNGKVFSIEPQQRLWEVIEKNYELNYCANATIIPYAVSEKEERLIINLYPTINTGASSLSNEENFGKTRSNMRKKFFGTQHIQTKQLDNLAEDYHIGKINLIKIDIEGFEFFALRSAKNLLKNKLIDHIFVEFHPSHLRDLGQSTEEIAAFLISFGYEKSNKFDFGLVNGEKVEEVFSLKK